MYWNTSVVMMRYSPRIRSEGTPTMNPASAAARPPGHDPADEPDLVLHASGGERADGEEGGRANGGLSGVAGDQVEAERADGRQDGQVGVVAIW